MPQFGHWDHMTGAVTNYSMVFSQVRATRKNHKYDWTGRTIEHECELLNKQQDKPVIVSL